MAYATPGSAVASSARGGVIRQGFGNNQYVDRFGRVKTVKGGGGSREYYSPIEGPSETELEQRRLAEEAARRRAEELERQAKLRAEQIERAKQELARQRAEGNISQGTFQYNKRILENIERERQRQQPVAPLSPMQQGIERPILVVEPALTPKQQLRKNIEERGYIQGTLRFIGEKAQGALSRAEQRFTPRGQSLASTRILGSDLGPVSFGIQTAPYSIPVAGPVLLTISGGEQALNTKLPLSDRILGAATATIGGIATYRNINKALGFPKYETTFLQKQIQNVDDTVITRSAALTTQRNLLTSNRFISGTETISKLRPGDDVTLFESLSRIGIRKSRGVEFLRPEQFGKTKPALSGSVGTIIERPIVSELRSSGLKISQELSGVEVRAFSRTSTPRLVREPAITERFSIGIGTRPNEDILVSLQRSFPIERVNGNYRFLRSGRSTSVGVTSLQKQESEVATVGTQILGKTRRTAFPVVEENLVKQAIEDSIRATEKTRNFPVSRVVPVTKTVTASSVGGSVSSQVQNLDQRIRTSFATGQREAQRQRQGSYPTIVSRTGNVLRNPQRTDQGTVTDQGVRSAQALRQEQQLLQQTQNQFDRVTAPGITPEGFGFPVIGFRRRDKKRAKALATLAAYNVFVKRRGKQVLVARGLPRGRALGVLSDRLLSELARSGRIVESGTTDVGDVNFYPSARQFRTFRRVKGRRVSLAPDTFIQRTSANLQNQVEKQLLVAARRR